MADNDSSIQHLRCRTIIEVLGKPKEHVETTLKKVQEELSKREGVKILTQEVAETKELEKFFSSYIDLEISLTDIDKLIDFCFDFMPSSIEILEPEKLSVGNLFDQLGLKFTSTCFIDHCNSDKCPDGKEGKKG